MRAPRDRPARAALRLHRDTLRLLSQGALSEIRGGDGDLEGTPKTNGWTGTPFAGCSAEPAE